MTHGGPDRRRPRPRLAEVTPSPPSTPRCCAADHGGGTRPVLDRQASVPGIPRAVRAVALADGRAESWLETCGPIDLRRARAAAVRASGRAVGRRPTAQGGRRLVRRRRRGDRIRRAGQVPAASVRRHPRGRAVEGEAHRGPCSARSACGSSGSPPTTCRHAAHRARPPRAAPAGHEGPGCASSARSADSGRWRGADAGDDGWLVAPIDGVGAGDRVDPRPTSGRAAARLRRPQAGSARRAARQQPGRRAAR